MEVEGNIDALQEIPEDEEYSRSERLYRYIELKKIFGPQGDTLLQGGVQSHLAFHELGSSYIFGNYMAVFLLVQAFIGTHYQVILLWWV